MTLVMICLSGILGRNRGPGLCRRDSDRDMFDGTGEDETLATDGAMGGGGER